MKKGDELQIKGMFGFLMNPTMVVIDVNGGLVQLISKDRIDDNAGILSHMNLSWHSIDLLKDKIS